MTLQPLLDDLGPEIDDVEEEAFLLFSQSIPSRDLGFVDGKATEVQLTVNGRDLAIQQSPTVLSSNRGGGTTGAVIWKITPLFASWISSPNIFSKHGVLSSSASVIELGCGISGIIGLLLGPLISSYLLTDQDYVMKFLKQNLSENHQTVPAPKNRKSSKAKKSTSAQSSVSQSSISTQTLDWEQDDVASSLAAVSLATEGFDCIIACDCIYNDTLIEPLVQTCIDICKLRPSSDVLKPTLCVVAQQLRSAEVFEAWLQAFHKAFRVWHLQDNDLMEGLRSNSGFVIHVGTLRNMQRS